MRAERTVVSVVLLAPSVSERRRRHPPRLPPRQSNARWRTRRPSTTFRSRLAAAAPCRIGRRLFQIAPPPKRRGSSKAPASPWPFSNNIIFLWHVAAAQTLNHLLGENNSLNVFISKKQYCFKERKGDLCRFWKRKRDEALKEDPACFNGGRGQKHEWSMRSLVDWVRCSDGWKKISVGAVFKRLHVIAERKPKSDFVRDPEIECLQNTIHFQWLEEDIC